MAKKKKTKSASQKKKSAVKVETWVDRLDFVPIEHDSINDSSTTRIRIVSWNILAESYLTPTISSRVASLVSELCLFSSGAPRRVAQATRALLRSQCGYLVFARSRHASRDFEGMWL